MLITKLKLWLLHYWKMHCVTLNTSASPKRPTWVARRTNPILLLHWIGSTYSTITFRFPHNSSCIVVIRKMIVGTLAQVSLHMWQGQCYSLWKEAWKINYSSCLPSFLYLWMLISRLDKIPLYHLGHWKRNNLCVLHCKSPHFK